MNLYPRRPIWKTILHIILLRPLVRALLGLNISGREHLDHLDQFIIIANHNSHLDVTLLFCLLPIRHIARTHPVADKPYFARHPFLFRFAEFFFSPIWISRGQPDTDGDPFARIKAVIAAGHSVIIFPEGTRGEPGQLQHFRSGIGRLMTQYPELPIVPVFLTGPERALPKSSGLLLPIWNNVIVGPPQCQQGGHREITRRLESTVSELGRSQSAHRHHRPAHERKPIQSIALLGIDGSGKSTQSERLARAMSASATACLIGDKLTFFEAGDPGPIQPLATERVRRIISNYAKRAKSLKLYKIPKLTELLLRNHLQHEAERWYLPDYIVLDGSPLLNLVAWSALYKADLLDEDTCAHAIAILSGISTDRAADAQMLKRFPELRHLKRLGLTHLALPDAIVLIDIPASEACKRIESRGESRQVHETQEKLESLRQSYLRVCAATSTAWHIPTAVIDGTQALDTVTDSALQFTRSIVGRKD